MVHANPKITKQIENLTFTEDTTNETLTVDGPADGDDVIAGQEIELTFTLKHDNKPVVGKVLHYSLSGDIASKGISINKKLIAKTKLSTFDTDKTDQNGQVKIKLSNQKSGTTTVNASYAKNAVTNKVNIEIASDDASAKVTELKANKEKVKFSKRKTDKITLTALVQDQYDNNVSNRVKVNFSVQNSTQQNTTEVTLSAPVAGVVEDGKATTDLSSNLATEITADTQFVVSAKANNNPKDPGQQFTVTYQK